MTHLAMAFAIAHPGVTSAIIGPRTMEQLDDLLASVDVTLTDDILDRIDEIVPPGTDVGTLDIGLPAPGPPAPGPAPPPRQRARRRLTWPPHRLSAGVRADEGSDVHLVAKKCQDTGTQLSAAGQRARHGACCLSA